HGPVTVAAERGGLLISWRKPTAGSIPAWSPILLRYASGEAARLSIGREGFDLPTERQSQTTVRRLGHRGLWRLLGLLLFGLLLGGGEFGLALALHIQSVRTLIGLDVLELSLLVAHRIKLGAL